MVSVRGTFCNGRAEPAEAVEAREGQPVIITFLEEGSGSGTLNAVETDWDALTQLLKASQVDAGIEDLAHQHEHYLYGTPKQPPPEE
jgi:hypothetical protein